MSSFLLEQTRANMEYLEQAEKAIILSLFNKQENVNKKMNIFQKSYLCSLA